MHRVVVVATDGVVPFDLATPCEVFACVRLRDGKPGYRVRVCGTRREIDAGAFRMRVQYGLEGALARGHGRAGRHRRRARPRARAPAARRAPRRRARRAGGVDLQRRVPARGDGSARRPPRDHALARARASSRAATRRCASIPTCSTSTRDSSSPRRARPRPSICACTWCGATTARRSRWPRRAPRSMPLERDGGQSQFIAHAPPTPDGALARAAARLARGEPARAAHPGRDREARGARACAASTAASASRPARRRSSGCSARACAGRSSCSRRRRTRWSGSRRPPGSARPPRSASTSAASSRRARRRTAARSGAVQEP